MDNVMIAMGIVSAFDDKLDDMDASIVLETAGVREGVETYVLEYKGNFSFMQDLHNKAMRYGFKKWSIALYRAVLNIMRADALRREQQANAEPVAPANVFVPNGIYTVVYDDESYRTVRVKAHWNKDEATNGVQVLQYLSGPDNGSQYTSAGFVRGKELQVWRKISEPTAADLVEAWRVLCDDPLAAGEAYALRSANCFRCNRRLTVPASLHRGLGPECVKHFRALGAA